MVISATDGWTSEDEMIFNRIWGSSSSKVKSRRTGSLTGPMSLSSSEEEKTSSVNSIVLCVSLTFKESNVLFPQPLTLSFPCLVA